MDRPATWCCSTARPARPTAWCGDRPATSPRVATLGHPASPRPATPVRPAPAPPRSTPRSTSPRYTDPPRPGSRPAVHDLPGSVARCLGVVSPPVPPASPRAAGPALHRPCSGTETHQRLSLNAKYPVNCPGPGPRPRW